MCFPVTIPLGTTTTIDTTNLNVEDKNITLNYSTGDSSSTADGAGITIQDAVDSSTDATILWDATNDKFDFSHGILLPDSKTLQLGSSTGSGDLQLVHDGTNSYIKNHVGNLYIYNHTDDGDTIFQGDDGSGGLATYITIDGSTNRVNFNKPIKIADNTAINVGSGLDLQLLHDGTDSVIDNFTGHFYIRNQADDKDIVFICDNSTGSTETYFRLDGSANTAGNPVTLFPDNSLLGFGEGFGDLQLHHDGSNSYIKNRSTGDLYIRQDVDDKDIILEADDGSGGVTPYITLDGSAARTLFSQHTRHLDNAFFAVGTGGDFTIDHDGSNTSLQNSTGELRIRNYADDQDIVLQTDDGSGGITDYIRLDGSVGNTYIYKGMRFVDGVEVILGTGGDVGLKHDGSNMTMINSTGDMAFYQNTDDRDMVFYCDSGS